MRTIITNIAQLVTLAAPDGAPAGRPRSGADMAQLGIIDDGAVYIDDGLVAAVGSSADMVPRIDDSFTVIDANGCAVVPGFIDCHTHLVYGGSRQNEFEMRVAGATYQEIASGGGGIRSTVKATRASSEEDLANAALKRLQRMLSWGTTMAEVKSGYGLDVETEIKILNVIRSLGQQQPVELVPTFMGAHEFPEEYRTQGVIDREGYLGLIIDTMIPRIAQLHLAEFCDIFCDQGVFTPAEAERVLAAGERHGLKPKIHADELAWVGAAEAAGAVGAVTAEHLLHPSEAGLAAMRRAGTIAVLLPGTSLTLKKQYAPARRMIELGIPVALATDCNPGSCTIESMPLVIGLACLYLGMTPAEALCAATVNAAWAVGKGEALGSIEPGKQADLLVLDVPDYRFLAYHFSVNHVRTVVKRGNVVVNAGAGP